MSYFVWHPFLYSIFNYNIPFNSYRVFYFNYYSISCPLLYDLNSASCLSHTVF